MTELMSHMKDHTQLINSTGDNLATWKNYTRNGKDNKALEAALSKYEDTSKYDKASSSRTFRVI